MKLSPSGRAGEADAHALGAEPTAQQLAPEAAQLGAWDTVQGWYHMNISWKYVSM